MNKRKDLVGEQTPEVSKPASVIEAPVKDKDIALEEKITEVVGQHTEDPLKEHNEPEVKQIGRAHV